MFKLKAPDYNRHFQQSRNLKNLPDCAITCQPIKSLKSDERAYSEHHIGTILLLSKAVDISSEWKLLGHKSTLYLMGMTSPNDRQIKLNFEDVTSGLYDLRRCIFSWYQA